MRKLFTLLVLLFVLLTEGMAQNTVSGTVYDTEENPLIGVTVVVKGSFRGTTTDVDGSFFLSYDAEEAVLVFSYLGYNTTEMIVTGSDESLAIVMEEEAQSLSAVEVVGTRNLNRSSTESVTPIDVLPVKDLAKVTGQFDVNQLLQFAAPSFNSNRQSGSDGADHIDPATLRGLGPDQTLVLINGQRMHQSSLVNLYGTRGRGNTGTDLNTIPTSAIDRIEVLRDGASAQYGSDAIAGVVNVILRKNVNEFNAGVAYGITSKGDGTNVQANGNYGVAIGDRGYVNVTADYLFRDHTFRDTYMEDGSYYRRKFGDGQQTSFSGFINSLVPLGENAEAYAFGGYSHRLTDAYAYSRNPGTARNIDEIYPEGFDPIIQSTIKDANFSTGVRGKINNWALDFCNTFGKNYMHYYVDETLNASMLTASPTRFDAGGFSQTQNVTNLTASRYYESVLSGLSVAGGFEFRNENYIIFKGEEASWANYGGTYFDGTDTITRPGGSQGFPGYRPENEVNEFRTNLGAYLDLELNPIKALTLAAAVRFERYSDFGNTFNYKFAARYDISPKFAVRAALSSGFRAPSLAQIYFNSTFTNVISGEAVDVVLARNNSALTQAIGVGALKQEESLNGSFGITAKPINGLSVTIDGYYISISDRIVLTGTFDPASDTTGWGPALTAQGIGGVQFFTNALGTKTMGVDAIISYARRFGNHRISLTYAGNYNKMELGDIAIPASLEGQEETFFGEREKRFLLASAPNLKQSFMIDYRLDRFNANLRFTYFDKVLLQDWIATDDLYRGKTTCDLSLGYNITDNISLTVGGSNIFNVYPDRQDIETETGGRYDAVQMGFNGSFFFGRLGLRF